MTLLYVRDEKSLDLQKSSPGPGTPDPDLHLWLQEPAADLGCLGGVVPRCDDSACAEPVLSESHVRRHG